ncbi:MAG: helix-turn-helix domain-containing protein [Haloarculaceae archaeon]
MHTDGNPPIKSTATSLDIVEAVNQRDGATLSELANRFDKPKSTVHDHLQTLTDAGYLAKEGREFRVSVRFLILSDTGT